MRYTVTAGGTTHVVEIDGSSVTVDGVATRLVTHGAGGPVRRLIVGDRSLEVTAVPGEEPGTWIVAAEGSRVTAAVLDERSQAIRAMTKGAALPHGPVQLRAPMPGLVVRIPVQEGEEVAAGTGLVVVEAMKMENELKAPVDGTVGKVHVVPGARVEKGAVLLDLLPS
jgi:biotin carboxyl carrier protein